MRGVWGLWGQKEPRNLLLLSHTLCVKKDGKCMPSGPISICTMYLIKIREIQCHGKYFRSVFAALSVFRFSISEILFS